MLKLLLRHDRYDLREEYTLRAVTIVLIILITALVVWGIALFAPYSQVFVEKELVENQLEEIRSSDVTKDRKKLEAISEVVSEKMNALDGTAINPSDVLRFVIEDQVTGVGLNTIGITFSRMEDEKSKEESIVARIELQGVASTRSSLVSLQKVLVNKDIFEAVNIPYSNFTEDEDIPFVVNVVSVELIEFFENG